MRRKAQGKGRGKGLLSIKMTNDWNKTCRSSLRSAHHFSPTSARLFFSSSKRNAEEQQKKEYPIHQFVLAAIEKLPSDLPFHSYLPFLRTFRLLLRSPFVTPVKHQIPSGRAGGRGQSRERERLCGLGLAWCQKEEDQSLFSALPPLSLRSLSVQTNASTTASGKQPS